MKIEVYGYKFRETIPKHIGYIDYNCDNFDVSDAEICFEICNWSLWLDEKPDCLHGDITSCSHGICFHVGDTGVQWLAKSVGWVSGDSTKIADYVRRNADSVLWM